MYVCVCYCIQTEINPDVFGGRGKEEMGGGEGVDERRDERRAMNGKGCTRFFGVKIAFRPTSRIFYAYKLAHIIDVMRLVGGLVKEREKERKRMWLFV